MKKLFLSLALLLTGAVAAQAGTLTVYCADGSTVKIEIPDASEFPSAERYDSYIKFLATAACGQCCDFAVNHWENKGDGDFSHL